MRNIKDEFHASNDILKVLFTLDFYCIKKNVNAELVILGGSAILLYMELVNGSFRPTNDIGELYFYK